MSKISLQPNASGTGTFTLESPNSNTNRTLSLPDETGTVATVENLPAGYTDADALDLFNATGSAPVYACRAWVNFDGTGTVSIRASGNVSSITDNGTGAYTVNFTTAMEDADYSVTFSLGFDNNPAQANTNSSIEPYNLLSSSFNVLTGNKNNDLFDFLITSFAIFR